MKKIEAVKEWREHCAPHIPKNDKPMFRESWNRFTDNLCKGNQITQKQYDTWIGPKETQS